VISDVLKFSVLSGSKPGSSEDVEKLIINGDAQQKQSAFFSP